MAAVVVAAASPGMPATASGTTEPGSLRDLAASGERPLAAGGRAALGRFAGQGHRYADELRALLDSSAAVRQLVDALTSDLETAARQLRAKPLDPLGVLRLAETEGLVELLIRPSVSCPLIALTQLATVWEVVEQTGLGGLWHVRQALGAGLVGHSQGVVSAVALASARSRPALQAAISTAVRLLWLIGLRTEAVEGGMALLEAPGLTRAALEAALAAAGGPAGGLCVAGRNLPQTYVLAGGSAALGALAEGVERGSVPELRGCRLRRLRIAAPFHSTMLAQAVPQIVADAQALGLAFAPLALPVYSTMGRRLEALPSLERLVGLVCSDEITWPETMAAVGPHAHVVEFGPGAPLPLAGAGRLPPLPRADGAAPAAGPGDAPKAAPRRLDLEAARSCVLRALAATMGCAQEEFDYEVPFFDMGLRSHDVARFAGALAEAMGGEALPAHELFDHPTVEQLALRLAAAGPATAPAALPPSEEDARGACPKEPAACVVWQLAKVLRCRASEVELDVPFSHMGLSTQEQAQLAASLGAELGLSMSLQNLLDLPTARRLTRWVQRRLHGIATLGPAWALVEPKDATFGHAAENGLLDRSRRLDVAAVLEVQQRLCGCFSEEEAQVELKQLQKACFPDGAAYAAALQARLAEEQGRICRGLGYDMDTEILREQALRITMEHGKRVPKLRELSHRLVLLTWPSSSDGWRW